MFTAYQYGFMGSLYYTRVHILSSCLLVYWLLNIDYKELEMTCLALSLPCVAVRCHSSILPFLFFIFYLHLLLCPHVFLSSSFSSPSSSSSSHSSFHSPTSPCPPFSLLYQSWHYTFSVIRPIKDHASLNLLHKNRPFLQSVKWKLPATI